MIRKYRRQSAQFCVTQFLSFVSSQCIFLESYCTKSTINNHIWYNIPRWYRWSINTCLIFRRSASMKSNVILTRRFSCNANFTWNCHCGFCGSQSIGSSNSHAICYCCYCCSIFVSDQYAEQYFRLMKSELPNVQLNKHTATSHIDDEQTNSWQLFWDDNWIEWKQKFCSQLCCRYPLPFENVRVELWLEMRCTINRYWRKHEYLQNFRFHSMFKNML